MAQLQGAFLRAHTLDDALLLFAPETGDSIRVDMPRAQGLRRAAPRVVLFSLSHACNLRCTFCSRDTSNQGQWRGAAAFDVLSALCDAGTLEVVFGGGEPLAHAGFLQLVQRLKRETKLAVHMTTNGALLDDATARALAPCLGETRVSIYDGDASGSAIERLLGAGGRVAANVLVHPDTLDGLPGLLEQLARLGCNNVALLRYIGADAASHLRPDQWARLEQVVIGAPLSIRLSHCFADRMPRVPRLFEPGDCGAGRDFLVIEPDRSFAPCSFHHARAPFRDVEELLSRYRISDEQMMAPADARGCARGPDTSSSPSPGIRCYSGFSSNNSGDTVLVARFQTAEEPAALARALANLEPYEDRERWLAFLRAEGCDVAHLDQTLDVRAAGRSLLATGYDAYDGLPGVREAVTRRGARIVYSAVHLHDSSALLVGLGGAGGDETVQQALWTIGADEVERHGDSLFASISTGPSQTWTDRLAQARDIAEAAGASLGAELVPPGLPERLVDGCKTVSPKERHGYLQIHVRDAEAARSLAESMDGVVSWAGRTVIVETERDRARLGLRTLRASGISSWLPRDRLRIVATFYRHYGAAKVDRAAVAGVLAERPVLTEATLEMSYRAVVAKFDADQPHPILEGLRGCAEALDVMVHVHLAPARTLSHALGRLKRDLRVVR